jgi:hypothetical protein
MICRFFSSLPKSVTEVKIVFLRFKYCEIVPNLENYDRWVFSSNSTTTPTPDSVIVFQIWDYFTVFESQKHYFYFSGWKLNRPCTSKPNL